MRNPEISRQIQRARALVDRTTAACGGDIELQAEWARYLCIVVAGVIENGLKAVYSDFTEKSASKPVAAFAKGVLSRIQNPKAETFLQTAGGFSGTWRAELEKYLDDSGGKDAINSIMANRHLIAHGKSSAISMAFLKDYFAKSVAVLEFIEEQCNR